MNKLILFDIDGTLVLGTKQNNSLWQERVAMSIQETYGVKPANPDPMVFNGFVDRNLFWHLVRDTGISKDRFDSLFPKAARKFHALTSKQYKDGYSNWTSIPEAVAIVERLLAVNHTTFGVITGNIEKNGWLKLEAAGIKHMFEFGAFADTVDNRSELAIHAVNKAEKHFGRKFTGQQIVLIGDTKYDVRAGKHIGATTIAVLTGTTETHESLIAEGPDLVVDSLMDVRVLDLVGLA